jgi:tetratricopeptide (TPR) repeat protein
MKKGQVFFVVISLALAASAPGYAAATRGALAKLYAQGNAEYQKGNFASAEQYYRQILDAGSDGSAVYYNLGNACFKLKKLGDAIYYWEKAQQRAPADRDIRENLQLANLLIVDRIETRPDPLPVRVLSAIPTLLTIKQESWLVFSLFVVANLAFAVYRTSKSRNSFRALLASLAAGLLFKVFAS